MSDDLTALSAKVDKLEDEVRGLRWWIAGAAICLAALSLGVIQLQAGWFQKTIDAHQKISEARMDEFRRDSDRNYELAIRALERSVAQANTPQTPPSQQ